MALTTDDLYMFVRFFLDGMAVGSMIAAIPYLYGLVISLATRIMKE